LFRVIHAVIENEEGDSSKACLFFSIAGAYLLDRSHAFKGARPVAGIAGYNLRTPTNLSIIFGAVENGEWSSDENNFHCWIEVDGWIIDFTAPLFDDMAPSERKGAPVPRLMFQKPAVADVENMETPGAYMHVPNSQLTAALMAYFVQKPAHSDLIDICKQWYERPPKKMASSIGISDQHGTVKEVRLSRLRVEGAW
jgi:hypothetical protein